MEIQYKKEYSCRLMRDMEFKIYGHGGQPFLFFPCQNGRFYDFEDFGMLDPCRKYLDEGKMQLFTVDSIDGETWSKEGGDPAERIALHERWFQYVTEELSPRIIQINQAGRGSGRYQSTRGILGIIAMGFSMGGYHSTNCFLRRPDIFSGNLSLSGLFEASYFFHGFMNALVYHNSPCDYLKNMALDHYYISMYNERKNVICMGQGAWEEEMVSSARKLERIMEEKGIHAWFDYWGYDVSHDWYWWKRQTEYFLPYFLSDKGDAL